MHPFLSELHSIVKRTAQPGLDAAKTGDAELARWFYIWCGDISGELGEACYAFDEYLNTIGAEESIHLTEVGDVLWGIGALSLLLNIDLKLWDSMDPRTDELYDLRELEVIRRSLSLQEIGKKCCRDGLAVRPIDVEKVASILEFVLNYLNAFFCLQKALEFVDQKLRLRYPNGFTPEASVNRQV